MRIGSVNNVGEKLKHNFREGGSDVDMSKSKSDQQKGEVLRRTAEVR